MYRSETASQLCPSFWRRFDGGLFVERSRPSVLRPVCTRLLVDCFAAHHLMSWSDMADTS